MIDRLPGAPGTSTPKPEHPRLRLIIAGRDWTRLVIAVAVMLYLTTAVVLGTTQTLPLCEDDMRFSSLPCDHLTSSYAHPEGHPFFSAIMYAIIPFMVIMVVGVSGTVVWLILLAARWLFPQPVHKHKEDS